jgi:hypothetical protein
VLGDLGVDELAAVGFERRQRSAFVSTHEARVPGHIERHDGGQSPMVPRRACIHRTSLA